MSTAVEIVEQQERLEAEARAVLPFDSSVCSGPQPRSQALFACQTCPNARAVCYACSISCHADHALVELFVKRDFACDCGTLAIDSPCTLLRRQHAPNNDNEYSKNFQDRWCTCGRVYDVDTEEQEMYCCVVCQDWLHHRCLFGLDAEHSPLGPDDFEGLICAGCVATSGVRAVVERYAGVEGSGVMVIDEEGKVRGNLLDEEEEEEDTAVIPKTDEGDILVGSHPDPDVTSVKRARSTSSSPIAKRVKFSPDGTISCTAPPLPTPTTPSLLSLLAMSNARQNVYLQLPPPSSFCVCPLCLPAFAPYPYLLVPTEVYSPPLDLSAHTSTLELGLAALASLPVGQAIEGALAWRGLTDRLKTHLSQLGGVVSKEDVEAFFAGEKERLLRLREEKR